MTSAKRPAAGFGLITRNISKSNTVALATLRGSTLSQLLFNQEVMFVTALGKLMAPFPHRRGKKKGGEKKITWEVHTAQSHTFGRGGEEGKVRVRALGFPPPPLFFLYFITALPVCYQQQRDVRHRAHKKKKKKAGSKQMT